MKRAAHILIAVAVGAIFAASVQSCIDRRKDFAQYPMNVDGDVRVLLADGKRFTVSVAGPYQILSGGNVLFRDERPMPKVNVGPAPNGIALGTKALAYPRLEIVPRVDGSLLVSGKAYRGRLLLIRRKKGLDDKGLAAVNVLPLDDYLAGVISGEMPAHWPMPALRAQAVAARTYALYRQRKRTKWNYDVTAGTGDQVYKGVAGETASARRAVDQTRGVVLLYNWKFLPAYYHSVCGGHTAARKNVFDEADITPLAGVRCGYCNPKRHGMRSSKFYRWQFRVSQSKLLGALAAKGHKLKKIKAIRPAKPGPGGHMARLTILPAVGKPFELSIHELRSMIGYGKIISNSFECSTRGGALAFAGKGFGHGVGMCQWGAKGMADSGYGFDQILQY
ncbi:MAG: SpoIID/LytB domain-containing protein, partial [Planctomycetes bacterium]|nr:SpoIID/LytB domain-containing protein [Planctomycetota bacterium]